MTMVAETATLAWGYTMADVSRAARVATSKHFRSRSLDTTDREEAAWHGVVVELYHDQRREAPTFYELLSAGMRALDREVAAHQQHHGWERNKSQPAPKFQRYWLPVRSSPDDGFSDRICETMALADVLGALTNEQYEAIATLAAFNNDVAGAAAALGLKYHCFYYRVLSGRRKITAAWYDDETPVTSRPVGETCRVGHARADHGRQLPDGRWQCRVCSRAANRRRAARTR